MPARQSAVRATASMSRPARPSGQRSRLIAISPFSTRVNGRTASGGTGPTGTVRVMSVVPSAYWPPLSTSRSSPGRTGRFDASVTR